MSNTNSPNGFLAVDHLGSGYNIPLRMVAFVSGDGTAAFRGDLVKFTGAVDATGVIPVVTQCSASDSKIAGAIQQFFFQYNGNWAQYYRTANTNQYAYIPADPQQLYVVQEDSVGGNIDTATKIGDNCDFVVGAGDTTTGASGMQLDSSTAANTNTLPIRLVSPLARVDNDPTTASSNGAWIVKINLNSWDNTTGT